MQHKAQNPNCEYEYDPIYNSCDIRGGQHITGKNACVQKPPDARWINPKTCLSWEVIVDPFNANTGAATTK